MPRSRLEATATPHSWDFESWPRDVYPGSESRGRYVVRMNRGALLAEGAIVRVGRELVILGEGYSRWLKKQAARVPDFDNGAVRSGPRAAA